MAPLRKFPAGPPCLRHSREQKLRQPVRRSRLQCAQLHQAVAPCDPELLQEFKYRLEVLAPQRKLSLQHGYHSAAFRSIRLLRLHPALVLLVDILEHFAVLNLDL
jgi:hypothetical protein